jgi:hypothetical protein
MTVCIRRQSVLFFLILLISSFVALGPGDVFAGGFSEEALLKPTNGLKPQQLFFWKGLVVLNHHDTMSQQPILDLMALGLRSTFIEEKTAAGDVAGRFSNWFLPPDSPYYYGGGWKGADEFQRADSREAFLKKYADGLRELAPRIPYQFAYVLNIDLREYDSSEHGFSIDTRFLASIHLKNGDLSLARPQGNSISLVPEFQIGDKLLWPLDEKEARKALEAIRNGSVVSPRRVSVLAVLEAVDGNPNLLSLRTKLKQLLIYDEKMEKELYSFDIAVFNEKDSAEDSLQGDDPTKLQEYLALSADQQEKLNKETELFVRDCKVNSAYATFHNCSCLGRHYLLDRIRDPDKSASEVSGSIELDCVDVPSIQAHSKETCLHLYAMSYRDVLPSLCECYANDFAAAYAERPGPNSAYKSDLGATTFAACKSKLSTKK